MSPSIFWNIGTAYDLLVSLHVLHHPERFGVRPAWAAGVRSRLPAEDRRFLQTVQDFVHPPLTWLHALEGEKSALAFLQVLTALPAADRLPAFVLLSEMPAAARGRLAEVTARRSWNQADLEFLRPLLSASGRPFQSAELDFWADPAAFGEHYLAALQNYYSVFFAEEEQRILPALHSALQRARQLSGQMELSMLVDVLSHGVHFPDLETRPSLDLVPSYWITPLIFFGATNRGGLLLLFGARPDTASHVPGGPVSPALLAPLKALADPTRLRVLRLLSGETLTLTQIASRLRLRPPTMVHHLNALRLAGLVQVDFQPDGEKRYSIRRFAIDLAFQSLENFLDNPE